MVSYTPSKPDHLINDYRAWTLNGSQHLPFDTLWINCAGADPRPHRVLPSGEPSISIRRIWNTDGSISKCELVVCCQYSAGLWHRPPPREELISIRLKPEIAAITLGIDLIEYRDSDPLPVPRWLASKLCVSQKIAEQGAHSELVARSLFKELQIASKEAHITRGVSTFIHAAAILREYQGGIPIRQVAKELGISARTLQRQFIDHLGVSPKFYARRLRLTHAAILADQSEQVIWADVAASCGFHDQAHLINEYQSLIGLTPNASHRERLGLSDFSNSC